MHDQAPLPMAHAFLVCREVLQDVVTGECVLIEPKIGWALPRFPGSVRAAIYGQLSEMGREYYPELRLWGPDGEISWDHRPTTPMTSRDDDPLRQYRVIFRDLTITFPCPGRYDLLLLAHGMEIARYPLRVKQRETPTP